MKANEMRKIIAEPTELENALSKFLSRKDVVDNFRLTGRIKVDTDTLNPFFRSVGASQPNLESSVINILRKWGYLAKITCEDRPCGNFYYEITLPPGNE